jgi:hypothetical protein
LKSLETGAFEAESTKYTFSGLMLSRASVVDKEKIDTLRIEAIEEARTSHGGRQKALAEVTRISIDKESGVQGLVQKHVDNILDKDSSKHLPVRAMNKDGSTDYFHEYDAEGHRDKSRNSHTHHHNLTDKLHKTVLEQEEELRKEIIQIEEVIHEKLHVQEQFHDVSANKHSDLSKMNTFMTEVKVAHKEKLEHHLLDRIRSDHGKLLDVVDAFGLKVDLMVIRIVSNLPNF